MGNDQGLREVGKLKQFDPGLDIRVTSQPLGFVLGKEVFGPAPELRELDAIRRSLRDPNCAGPDPVYAIAMDVGKTKHRELLLERSLLFGVVAYAQGRLGSEPVRSQGHVHRVSKNSGWSPPEIYEIWQGKAVVYMQESASDHPGRCYAIQAEPGQIVVVPPGWAHATISADPQSALVFGAWCDRDYGFEYEQVRAHAGLAWYPLLDDSGKIEWHRNPNYIADFPLQIRGPAIYRELGLDGPEPIYSLLEKNPDLIAWTSDPIRKENYWPDFEP